MKYTIEELAQVVNSKLKDENNLSSLKDNRFVDEISVRRIRDYITKKSISSPIREGRNVYFTDEHVNELLNLRKLQKSGLSEKFITNSYSSNLNEDSGSNLQISGQISNLESSKNLNLAQIISSIENREYSKNVLQAQTSLLNTFSTRNLKNDIEKNISKISYSEYEIEKGVYLKIENSIDEQKQLSILQKIKGKI